VRPGRNTADPDITFPSRRPQSTLPGGRASWKSENKELPVLAQVRAAVPIADLERLSITWNHVIDKESLNIKELEHVLIEKVEQRFRDVL
jgi:hypothetical protein